MNKHMGPQMETMGPGNIVMMYCLDLSYVAKRKPFKLVGPRRQRTQRTQDSHPLSGFITYLNTMTNMRSTRINELLLEVTIGIIFYTLVLCSAYV